MSKKRESAGDRQRKGAAGKKAADAGEQIVDDALAELKAAGSAKRPIETSLWTIDVPLPARPTQLRTQSEREHQAKLRFERATDSQIPLEDELRARAAEVQDDKRRRFAAAQGTGKKCVSSAWGRHRATAKPDQDGVPARTVRIQVRVVGKTVEFDDQDAGGDTLNRRSWKALRQALGELTLRLDQGQPEVTLGDGRPVSGQTVTRKGKVYGWLGEAGPEARAAAAGAPDVEHVTANEVGKANSSMDDEARLSEIPELDMDSGLWVRNKAAALLTGLTVASLKTYRNSGWASKDKMAGIDPAGRKWRRPGHPQSHPWYYRPSLPTLPRKSPEKPAI